MKSSSGAFELETPRDRSGTFEPQLVKKHQTHVSDEIETKILSMYGRGMSYQPEVTTQDDHVDEKADELPG
jgi:putative transposase